MDYNNYTSYYSTNSYKNPDMINSLGGSLITGMAFGTTSEVTNNLVRGITGQSGHSYVQQQQGRIISGEQPPLIDNNPCSKTMEQLSNCLFKNQDHIADCQIHFDHLKQCRRPNNV